MPIELLNRRLNEFKRCEQITYIYLTDGRNFSPLGNFHFSSVDTTMASQAGVPGSILGWGVEKFLKIFLSCFSSSLVCAQITRSCLWPNWAFIQPGTRPDGFQTCLHLSGRTYPQNVRKFHFNQFHYLTYFLTNTLSYFSCAQCIFTRNATIFSQSKVFLYDYLSLSPFPRRYIWSPLPLTGSRGLFGGYIKCIWFMFQRKVYAKWLQTEPCECWCVIPFY